MVCNYCYFLSKLSTLYRVWLTKGLLNNMVCILKLGRQIVSRFYPIRVSGVVRAVSGIQRQISG